MTSPLVTPPDVEAALLRPLTATESSYIATLVAQASALLRNAAPSIDARIAAYLVNPTDPTAVSPDVVKAVLSGVIKRYLTNPEGAVSLSETVGPYARSTSYALRGDKDVRGALQITEADLAALFPSRKRLRAGTIRVRPSLAPRPVGRYGPLPVSAAAAADVALTYGADVVLDAESPIFPNSAA